MFLQRTDPIIIIILLLIKNTYYSRAGPRIAMLV